MSSPEDFPEDTILGNVRLDIQASTRTGDVAIFHEGEFEDPVIGFEYDVQANELVFIFEGDMAMALGAPIERNLIKYIKKADKIGLFQVIDDKTIGKGDLLPLTHI